MFLTAVIAIERGMEYNMSPLSQVKPLTQKDAYSLLSVMTHLSMITLLWGFSVALGGDLASKYNVYTCCRMFNLTCIEAQMLPYSSFLEVTCSDIFFQETFFFPERDHVGRKETGQKSAEARGR